MKKAKIDNLNIQYKFFRLKKWETIWDIITRSNDILNEIYFLGELITTGKDVRKLLCVLPELCYSKVKVITEARDLDTLAMNELIVNLTSYKLKIN